MSLDRGVNAEQTGIPSPPSDLSLDPLLVNAPDTQRRSIQLVKKSVRNAFLAFSAMFFAPAGLALIDQVVVSGARFATTMIIGRFCGPEGLGFYVVAFAVIVGVGLAHESLLAKPYQVFSQRMRGKRYRSYTASTLAQVAVLASIACLVTILASVIMVRLSAQAAMVRVALALTVTLPGVLVWEFVRRQAFARMRMGLAVLIDGALATLQIFSLLYLGWLEELSVARGLVVIGISGTSVGILAIYLQRKSFLFQPHRLCLDTRRNWRFGKWLFAGQMVGLAQAYAVPSLLAYHFGAVSTGIVMACQTIVLLSNPLLLGIANWLGPASARAYANGGVVELSRLMQRSAVALFTGMLFFWAGLALFGEMLLVASFSSQYAGYGHIVGITGLSALGFGMSVCGTSGLAAIERPRLIPVGALLGTIVTLVGFMLLTGSGELTGAAMALGLGSISSAGVHMHGQRALWVR